MNKHEGLSEQLGQENSRAIEKARAAAAGFIATEELERDILDPSHSGNVTSLKVTEPGASDTVSVDEHSKSPSQTA